MNYIELLIEHESFVINPLLETERFIKYCSERKIKIDKKRLERLEKLGIFYPIVRFKKEKYKEKVKYSEDRKEYTPLGMLSINEKWDGEVIEKYEHISFRLQSISKNLP